MFVVPASGRLRTLQARTPAPQEGSSQLICARLLTLTSERVAAEFARHRSLRWLGVETHDNVLERYRGCGVPPHNQWIVTGHYVAGGGGKSFDLAKRIKRGTDVQYGYERAVRLQIFVKMAGIGREYDVAPLCVDAHDLQARRLTGR